MASMGFDQTTVREMMSLVDEHRDELKEADYLKICNALKYLHQRIQTPPTPTPTPTSPLRSPFYQTTGPSETDRLLQQIRDLECRVRCMRESIRFRLQPRYVNTVNSHRQSVIEELKPDVRELLRGPRGGAPTMTTAQIKHYTDILIQDGLLTGPQDLKDRADQKKVDQCNAIIARTEDTIRDMEAEIVRKRQRLQGML
jgi:hypothetical protein